VLFRVVLPLIRLPLTGGLMLLLMEVLSDYGVIRYFNIKTVSGLIFESWFGMGDTTIAIRLSFGIMFSIALILVLEQVLRGRKRFNLGSGQGSPISPIRLTGWRGLTAAAVSATFLAVAFFIPVMQLAAWSWLALPTIRILNLGAMITSSLTVSLIASAAILILSVYFAQAQRHMHGLGQTLVSKIVQLGYSIPGAVIAIGAISLFTSLDSALYPLYQWIVPGSRKLILSTSLVMLLFAFVARYLAVGYNSVSAGFTKVGNRFGEAARTLGHSRMSALLRVELPMMKSTLISGFILAFVDISKELPLTLLLRPFNFNTLASRVYEYANDERIHEASVPALLLILLCLAGILAMMRLQGRQKGNSQK
jgi:iron(III) transport system permease protein